jgi:predicted nucleic acid-binding protein
MARRIEPPRRHERIASRKASLEAYVDTSALIAFRDKSDSYNLTFKRLFSTPPPLITSALVVVEGHGWFLRRYDRHRAMEFLVFIETLPNLTVTGFDDAEAAKSRAVLSRFGDQNLTLADAHGLVIMKDRRNAICWSTDRHLSLTGVALAVV